MNPHNERLITEEEESQIRQVASDINERAFYGKLLKTKVAIQSDKEFAQLSPRSKEIGMILKRIQQSYKEVGKAPQTTLEFYRIGKMLGRGAFGKVNLAMHKLVRKLVAIKALNKETL